MIEQTKRILDSLFSEAVISAEQPSADELYAYAEAFVKGENVAAQFPQQHGAQLGVQNAHFQAMLALLHQEQAGTLELPPIAAQFNFDYLNSPVTSPRPWRVELERLVVTLTDQVLHGLTPSVSALAYRKSASEMTIFTLALAEEHKGVKLTISGRATQANAAACTVAIVVESTQRRWPRLGGIPITLTTEHTADITQVTDAFGRTQFLDIPRLALVDAQITVGPLQELLA